MDASSRPAVSPAIVLTVGVFFVSTAAIFIRFAQQEAGSLAVAAWRMSLAALILMPFAASRRGELARLSRAQLLPALLAGLFLALHFATWITSLAYTSVASSVVIVDTAPLWVALLAPLLLGETINRSTKIGMLLAVGGGILVGISDVCSLTDAGMACPQLSQFWQGRAFVGDLLALAGAISAAFYLIIGRRVRAVVSLTAYILIVYSAAAVVLVIVLLVSDTPATGFSANTIAWLLAMAVFPQLLGHTAYNWALGYLPTTYVSIALLGEPIGSALLAVIFLGEVPSAVKIFGAALILAGIFIAARSTAS